MDLAAAAALGLTAGAELVACCAAAASGGSAGFGAAALALGGLGLSTWSSAVFACKAVVKLLLILSCNLLITLQHHDMT